MLYFLSQTDLLLVLLSYVHSAHVITTSQLNMALDVDIDKRAKKGSKQDTVPRKTCWITKRENIWEHMLPYLFALNLTFTLWLAFRLVRGSKRTDLKFLLWVFQCDHEEQSHSNEGEELWQQYRGCPLLAPGPHKDLIIPPPHPSLLVGWSCNQTGDSVFPFLCRALGTLLRSLQPVHSTLSIAVVCKSHCGKVIKV